MKQNIAIIGLGYVGLPLAYHFAKKTDMYSVIGFDISPTKITNLRAGHDDTDEIGDAIKDVSITYTTNPEDLKAAHILIVTVPTPIDEYKKPDLTPLIKASTMIGTIIQPWQIVVYESTVYPGCTEEDCIPLIEKASWLVYNKDFFAGYSPERINPGDKEHTVDKITKVVSGSTPEVAQKLAAMYGSINNNNVHLAPSLAVAEAAKVIENTQRDINIWLINELSLIFSRLWINTYDVLAAAWTKWNFLKFTPWLVGWHCIGVDPYYLASKAASVWHHSDIILAGRRTNESMAHFISTEVIMMLFAAGKSVWAKVLIAWLTFKEDVPDFRNSKIADAIKDLKDHWVQVYWFDPYSEVLSPEILHELHLTEKDIIHDLSQAPTFDGLIYAQNHAAFAWISWEKYLTESNVVFDIRHALPKNAFNAYKSL